MFSNQVDRPASASDWTHDWNHTLISTHAYVKAGWQSCAGCCSVMQRGAPSNTLQLLKHLIFAFEHLKHAWAKQLILFCAHTFCGS